MRRVDDKVDGHHVERKSHIPQMVDPEQQPEKTTGNEEGAGDN